MYIKHLNTHWRTDAFVNSFLILVYLTLTFFISLLAAAQIIKIDNRALSLPYHSIQTENLHGDVKILNINYSA